MSFFECYTKQPSGYWVASGCSHETPKLRPGEICKETTYKQVKQGERRIVSVPDKTVWHGDPSRVKDYLENKAVWRKIGWQPSPERREQLESLPGFVLLGRIDGGNDWIGYVEHTFSMGTNLDQTQFYWSGPAVDNVLGLKHQIDGRKDAEHGLRHFLTRRLPGSAQPGEPPNGPKIAEAEIFDARADDLPVVIDWEKWIMAHEPWNNLSGVRNKYGCRNVSFRMKEDEDWRESA